VLDLDSLRHDAFACSPAEREDHRAVFEGVSRTGRPLVHEFPVGTVFERPGKVGVLVEVLLDDIVLQDPEPDPWDWKVQRTARWMREGWPYPPLSLREMDGSPVLVDGSCRYVALRSLHRSNALCVVWFGADR